MTDCFADDSVEARKAQSAVFRQVEIPMPLSLGGSVAIVQALSLILWMGNSD